MVIAALLAALACPAQPAVLVHRRPGVVRTTVVACHRGRRVVVRRARLVRRRAGSRITDVAGADRRVAWSELRYADGRVTGVVGLARLGARGVRERVVTRPRSTIPRVFEVVVTTRGELAWLVGRRVRVADRFGDFALLRSEDALGPLAVEDDRTLRWRTSVGLLGFHDWRPRLESGCLTRSRFRVLAETEQVVVSAADYPVGVRVIRACLRSRPTDPVIAQAHGNETLEIGGVAGPWVVVNRTIGGRGGGCEWVAVEVHDSRGYPGRGARPVTCERAPGPATPLVVSSTGAPVWIVGEQQRSVLLTAAGNGVIELDSSGPGGITGLVAEGDTVRWLRDGEPRSVRFP